MWAVIAMMAHASGAILSGCIGLPFMALAILLGSIVSAGATAGIRAWRHTSPEPWQNPVFQRAATVVLGGEVVPRRPDLSASELTRYLTSFLQSLAPASSQTQAAEILKAYQPQLEASALKEFQDDYVKQWRDIYASLDKLEARTDGSPIFTEPSLSVAAAIFVWHWLSFPVAPVLLTGARIMVVLGLVLFARGALRASGYSNGSTVISFLFSRSLDRNGGGPEVKPQLS